MTVHLDTSIVIAALAAPRTASAALARLIGDGHVPAVSTPVLFEWRRGPRTEAELRGEEALFPSSRIAAFDIDAATTAAALYRQLSRRRHRDIDIAIAACAIEHNAALWTLNSDDFRDIPGLRLYEP